MTPIVTAEDTDGDGIFSDAESEKLAVALFKDDSEATKAKGVKLFSGKTIHAVVQNITAVQPAAKEYVKTIKENHAKLKDITPKLTELAKQNALSSHPALLSKIEEFMAWFDSVNPNQFQDEMNMPTTLDAFCQANPVDEGPLDMSDEACEARMNEMLMSEADDDFFGDDF